MTPPALLDLFCGQGGAAMGYRRAGFRVLGVDNRPQPRYPFPFVQADALEYAGKYGHQFDAIHASPPCHDHSDLVSITGRDGTADLLPDTWALLAGIGVPWVIENVSRARMPNALTLCGSQFGLGARGPDGVWRQLRRHRKFASSHLLMLPGPCRHQGQPVGVYGTGGGDRSAGRAYKGDLAESLQAMGIDWMDRRGISQAIPPAYTQWLGDQLLTQLRGYRPPVVQLPGQLHIDFHKEEPTTRKVTA